ncbi:MAG: DUF5335 family protein [Acidobacteria bacterium]|nr:DUF5335 family protein [Acidobacteriota bacterium]MBK8147017.1 DUF5335 family protein [Acidobacteriota bacterium]MBK8812427.1 DUF5335 family protein [Acidobacteriota bacterium]
MSNATIKKFEWTRFLRFYGEQNRGRRTRLGVFENGNDFWIEDGLPLSGIDFDANNGHLTTQIMIGDQLTHTIPDTRDVKITFSSTEMNDGLDITDADGKTTVLRFE